MYSHKTFTDKDSWTGGFYELAIEVGERDDSRLDAALRAIWQTEFLEGCWVDRSKEPVSSSRIIPDLSSSLDGHLYGIATLPNHARVACGVFIIREDAGDDARNTDWLGFYIPMGALATAYPVGAYPSGVTESPEWRHELDSWLTALGRSVFERVPYQLALIGHEVAAEVHSDELRQAGLPSYEWMGYLWQTGGRLEWYPPTVSR